MELKPAEWSINKEKSIQHPQTMSHSLKCTQDILTEGIAAFPTCKTLEGIALLQICAQGGLLQSQQTGYFLNRMTSTM